MVGNIGKTKTATRIVVTAQHSMVLDAQAKRNWMRNRLVDYYHRQWRRKKISELRSIPVKSKSARPQMKRYIAATASRSRRTDHSKNQYR